MRISVRCVIFWVGVALMGLGCEGTLLSPEPGSPPGGGPSVCSAEVTEGAVFRRLSYDEYRGSVQQILGDDEFEVELSEDDAVTFSLLGVEKVNSSVELLVQARPAGLMSFLTCDLDGPPNRDCAREYIAGLGRMAFRRPVSEEEMDVLSGVYDTHVDELGFADVLSVVTQVILQSPQMLYVHEVGVPPDAAAASRALTGYERATRLALMLWGAGPDQALLDRAERGELDTAEGVGVVARELIREPRARARIRDLVVGIFELDGAEAHVALDEAPKNEERFGEVSPAERKAMREEFEAFVDWALFESGDSFRALFTSNRAYVNQTLAARYGVDAPSEEWGWVDLPEDQRAGILTRLAPLAVLAHGDFQSPILRGAFLLDRFFCYSVGPPPADVDDTPVTGRGDGDEEGITLTVRELTAARTADVNCQGCHSVINPLGFLLEHYDAMGQWQSLEAHPDPAGGSVDLPVDASGSLPDTITEEQFYGAVELSEFAAGSERVRACLTNRWVRVGITGAEAATARCVSEDMEQRLRETGDILEVFVGVAQSSAFLNIRNGEGSGS